MNSDEQTSGISEPATPGDIAPARSTGSGQTTTTGDIRAGRQMLTGRSAQAALSLTSMTPSQLAWRKMKKNKLALLSSAVLIAMYVTAIFAQFVAPYTIRPRISLPVFVPPLRSIGSRGRLSTTRQGGSISIIL